MRKIAILAAGCALLALGACGKGEEEAAGGASGEAQTAQEVASEMKKISIQPGEWESTTEVVDVRMDNPPPGMPNGMLDMMKGRKTSTKNCITPEQAANPEAEFLASQKNDQCTYKGFQMTGGVIKGTVSCPSGDGGTADVAMTGSYTPASYVMEMEMNAANLGGPSAAGMAMWMKMRTTGKRIGECAADGK